MKQHRWTSRTPSSRFVHLAKVVPLSWLVTTCNCRRFYRRKRRLVWRIWSGVDNLPAELPLESSADFGDTLVPFVPQLARCDWSRPLGELALPAELSRAIIAHQGRLTPRFLHLEQALESA